MHRDANVHSGRGLFLEDAAGVGLQGFFQGCRDSPPVFYRVTGEPFKQSAELTGEPIKMKG